MLPLNLLRDPAAPLQVLCLGAHSDDIEIGCGGTILQLLSGYSNVDVRWIVFSSNAEREREARVQRGAFPQESQAQESHRKEVSRRFLPLRRGQDQGIAGKDEERTWT